MIAEETLRFRSALQSLKKQVISSKKHIKKLSKQEDLIEALRLKESTSGLQWAIDHIENWLKRGRDL
jgi:hypothetical protein